MTLGSSDINNMDYLGHGIHDLSSTARYRFVLLAPILTVSCFCILQTRE